jgi:S1-C subfamily serine protease
MFFARAVVPALLLVSGFQVPVDSIEAQARPQGTLTVTVALVAEELQVRPVPLFQLELVARADSTSRVALRTGLDGKVSQQVRPAEYRLRSVVPARLAGVAYAWDTVVTIRPGSAVSIELSNANASVDSSSMSRAPSRQIAPEIALYERVRRGVVRVQADLAHGTGFLVALDTARAVVVTNEHVIQGSRDVSIWLDTVVRIVARVVIKDHDADLAVLAIHPDACRGCPRLPRAPADSTGTVIVQGERVVAIGFPLHQRSTVTSGIVSAIRERVIISDVNINPGNSGGPLLNMSGQVVGINTFGDEGEYGPGIAGAILITQLNALLARAADSLSRAQYPEHTVLPVLSGPAYPIAELRAAAESIPARSYRKLEGLSMGNFSVTLTTPVAQFVWAKARERSVSVERRQREERAGLSEEERYSELASARDWLEYVGPLTQPAVSIDVVPKQGETTGSLLGRLLVNPYGQARLVFKGDLQDVRWYRNGSPMRPLLGGRAPQRVFVENAWVVMKDVAYRGYYVLPPLVFAPDSAGAPPSIVLQIVDLKHPDDRNLYELPAEAVARVWNDFGPYYRSVYPDRAFVVADPRRFRSNFERLCFQFSC